MDFFVEFLLPVFVVVILPISIVLIVNLTNKSRYNKKYSFLEKCVENGVEIDPDLLADGRKESLSSRATLKTKLLNRLTAGIILTLAGIGLLIWNLIADVDDSLTFVSIALIAVGIGLLIWYFVGKKLLAEDIKDEEETLSEQNEENK